MQPAEPIRTPRTWLRDYAPHLFWIGLAVASFAAGAMLEPRPDEYCYLFGKRVGGPCTFHVVTGFPCPQCGMTRSVAWAVRGEFLRSATYSPGGLSLFLAVQAAGVTAFVQAIRRERPAIPLSAGTVAACALAWAVVLVLFPFIARALGYMTLPM